MADYEDVYAPDLAEETTSTLAGTEQFVMFDSVEGKRGSVNNVGSYILQNGDADGEGHTVAEMIEAAVPKLTKEVTGNPITVDDALGEVDSLTVDLEPIQTGTPSPSSPAPITGRTSTTITVTDGTNTKTFTAPISTTVYGGTVGVTSGTGTSNMVMIDMGSMGWSYNSSYGFISTSLSGIIKDAPAYNVKGHLLSTIYPTGVYSEITGAAVDKQIGVSAGNYGFVVVRDTDYTSAAAFKTAVTGAMLCYETRSPSVLTSTPTEVSLYKGDNTVTADGDMDMVYVRDIVKVIEKLEG